MSNTAISSQLGVHSTEKTLINSFFNRNNIFIKLISLIFVASLVKIAMMTYEIREKKLTCLNKIFKIEDLVTLSKKECERLLKATYKYIKYTDESPHKGHRFEDCFIQGVNGSLFFVKKFKTDIEICSILYALTDDNFNPKSKNHEYSRIKLLCLHPEDMEFSTFKKKGCFVPKLNTVVTTRKDFEQVMKEKAIEKYGKDACVSIYSKGRFMDLKESDLYKECTLVGSTGDEYFHIAYKKGTISDVFAY